MGAVEQFFGAAGWTLVALGLASCLIPHCFRRGVVVMLAGDLCLFFGIVMPRTFMDLAFFSGLFGLGRRGYTACGIILAAILFALFMGPAVARIFRSRGAKGGDGAAHEAAGDGGSTRSPEGAGATADPSLFAKVKEAAEEEGRKNDAADAQDDGAAAPEDPRKAVFSGLDSRDRPL
jgi:hypothetical protein